MGTSKQPSAPTGAKLSEVVKISRQFLRSVRLDTDIGRDDALSGYVCQGTALSLLENMAVQVRDTRQRAFTWTGPYGCGKSSLALMLCSLVGGNSHLREKAMTILAAPSDSAIPSAFHAEGSGWLVVPVVGKRGRVSEEIAKALSTAKGEGPSKRSSKSRQDVIGELVALANAHPQGVLLIIDELGKFLESAAHEGDDIYFFQELAEAASRSSGKLILVGILHQSFDAYAARLGRQARDDWSKVQGRFVDIPLIAATDEIIELVAQAIEVSAETNRTKAEVCAKAIAAAIRERRPGTPASIGAAIKNCWPLHPVVAALLGPISRRRFSQNERSTFGFLASREPLGFVEFLDGTTVESESMYGPAHYWDYLRANLEPSILASPDGHRWAIATEAVERAEAKGNSLHVELAKCVALIETFRGGSGLAAEPAVLAACPAGVSSAQVISALKDLVGWRVLIERRHLNAYGVFAGSDFDIDGAINQSRNEAEAPDLKRLSALMDLQPILAKRLYHETGTMRWFTRRLVRLESAEQELSAFAADKGSVGSFLLCLPDLGTSQTAAKKTIRRLSESSPARGLVLGVPENADRIAELATELAACETVLSSRPELHGDAVARKELLGRISAVRTSLEDELGDAFSLSQWYWNAELLTDKTCTSISQIASRIAQEIYFKAPSLHSEMINREEPSSNAKKARKDLMYRMVARGLEKDLGYDSYPADAGLYFGIIKTNGLHRERDGNWEFGEPYHQGENREQLYSLWSESKQLLANQIDSIKLSALYEFWVASPYGLRAGIMPVLALALFLAHRGTLALYVAGVFTPDLTEAAIDEWLVDPKRISFRHVSGSIDQAQYIEAVTNSIPSGLAKAKNPEPLSVARALVTLVVGLPHLSKRTTEVSPRTQSIRAMLLKASDPNKVLFSDLPVLLDTNKPVEVTERLSMAFTELLEVYPRVLSRVRAGLLCALDQEKGDYERLRARALVVKGIAGEFRLEAFVARLEGFDGSDAATEGLISLATSKPPAQWVDRDIDSCQMQLGTWALDFRRAEALAPLRGRASTRRSLGLVFGGGAGRDVTTSIDIDECEAASVTKLAERLLIELQQQRPEVALAALAEAGTLLLTPTKEPL